MTMHFIIDIFYWFLFCYGAYLTWRFIKVLIDRVRYNLGYDVWDRKAKCWRNKNREYFNGKFIPDAKMRVKILEWQNQKLDHLIEKSRTDFFFTEQLKREEKDGQHAKH